MKIAVVGAGALGLYYGAMLQRAGNDVRFLLRRDYQAIREEGLRVTSPKGDFHLKPVRCALDPTELGPVDLVLVGLKTFANRRLIELVAPLMRGDNCVLTLQNGLGNEELLAATFGAERVLGGVAFLCSNRGEPGTVHHMGQGRIRLGEFSGGLSDRASALANLFNQAQVPCEAVDDLRRARWEKLVWNIPFNGLCALTGKNVSELLAHAPSRAQIVALMGEVIAAGNAQGLSQPIEADDFIAKMLSASETMDGYRPSMMIDRLECHPLELEAIYGVPLARAGECGVEMVRVGMLRALLELGEAG